MCPNRLSSFQVVFEPGEQFDSFMCVGRNPAIVDFLEWGSVQVVPAISAFPSNNDQAGTFKHLHVLHHSASVERIFKMIAQFAGRTRSALEQIQNLATSRIRKCLKDQIVGIDV